MWATTTVVKTGDFNGDGKSDILWRDSAGNTSIWLMNGATVAQTGPFVQIPNNWSIADTGDFNGDGSSDILWNDTSGNVQIWFMRGVAAKLRERRANADQLVDPNHQRRLNSGWLGSKASRIPASEHIRTAAFKAVITSVR